MLPSHTHQKSNTYPRTFQKLTFLLVWPAQCGIRIIRSVVLIHATVLPISDTQLAHACHQDSLPLRIYSLEAYTKGMVQQPFAFQE